MFYVPQSPSGFSVTCFSPERRCQACPFAQICHGKGSQIKAELPLKASTLGPQHAGVKQELSLRFR